LLERRPKALSGGQQQRVAVGRAIVGQPKVFLFDEPLSDLDATLRVQMRAEITKLHERLQATMIYVTHDQVEAMTMGDRIAVMDRGVVQQTDAPMTLYSAPANMFVAGFLGSPAMNLLHGTIKPERGALVFTEAGEGTVKLRLAEQLTGAAREVVAKQVVLGVRPEHLELVESPKITGKTEGSFPAVVDHVEALGAETHLYLHTGAHTVVCRTTKPLDPREGGRRRHFSFAAEQVHLFDPESGNRLAAA
jgi:multiple sugar transport system ATP-binding protein